MMTPNEEVNVNVQISPNGNITSSRGYELVFLRGVILSCSVDPFPGGNNSTMMNVRARENNASAPKRCGAQRVISVKVLLVISMLCKTEWS